MDMKEKAIYGLIEAKKMHDCNASKLIEQAWPEFASMLERKRSLRWSRGDENAYNEVFSTMSFQIFCAANRAETEYIVDQVAGMQQAAFKIALELGAWMYATGRLEFKNE